MAKKFKPPVDLKDPKNKMVVKLAARVRAEVTRRYGDELGMCQQRRDSALLKSR